MFIEITEYDIKICYKDDWAYVIDKKMIIINAFLRMTVSKWDY